MRGLILMLCLLIGRPAATAQDRGLDSLGLLLKVYKGKDARRAALLMDIAERIVESDHVQAYRNAWEARDIATPLNDHLTLARVNLIFAKEFCMYLDDQYSAVEPGLRSIREAELSGDSTQMARSYSVMYSYAPAVQPDTLEKYLTTSVSIARRMPDKKVLAKCLYNLARYRDDQQKRREARQLLDESLDASRAIGDQQNVIAVLVAIAWQYESTEQRDSALVYYQRSVEIARLTNEVRYRSYTLGRIALLMDRKGDHAAALEVAREALTLAKAHKLKKEVRDAYETLSLLHSARGDHQKALSYHLLFDSCSAAASNARTAANAGRLQAEFAYDRERERTAAREFERDLVVKTERKRQAYWLLFAASMATALTVIAVLVYRSLRRTRKAKQVIEEQKQLVEEKQEEIISSINYSKRLQDAILPPAELIEEYFPEHFVLYMPKDIVAGDFYWMKRVGDMLFVAAADCTGHGVPGALVSVVCASALREAVREYDEKEPGRVLDLVTNLVLENFGDGGTDVKDGMDISLLAIDLRERKAKWCGANIPLFLIPAVDDQGHRGPLVTINPDRQPVGRYDHRQPFTTVTLDVRPGSTFYLFTDGYADQFGGPRDKKFMRRSFRRLLDETASSGLHRQGEILRARLEEWRRGNEQTDDITVVGIRL